jgi:hypothetical protein
VALAACMGEYCGVAPVDDALQMLNQTALHKPLPPNPPLATVYSIILPVLCRSHAGRLRSLGLVHEAAAAAVRMSRHEELMVKVASVRVFGRMIRWATEDGCHGPLLAELVTVMQSCLAPDQDRALHAVRSASSNDCAGACPTTCSHANIHNQVACEICKFIRPRVTDRCPQNICMVPCAHMSLCTGGSA